MLKISGLKAFTESVRKIDESVSGIKLCAVDIKREERSVVYRFISEKTVSEEVQSKIADYCLSVTPPSFRTAEAVISKVVADSELVCAAVYKYITASYPSLTYDFTSADVSAEGANGVFRYTLRMIPSSCAYVRTNGTLKDVDAYLERNFCDSFVGSIVEKEQKEHVELAPRSISLDELSTLEKRAIQVKDVVVIDDNQPTDTALYIEDAAEPGEVTLCGVVTDIREKTTKTGKPFYIFEFDDTTGKTSGLYFTRKNTVDRIKKIQIGQGIIVRGKFDYYKDKLSLTINKINLCTFPTGFKPKPKGGKSAPLEYTVVKALPAEEVRETTLFDAPVVLPDVLKKHTFVVFDLETTGTEVDRDEITEIGAVKIVNGVIAETFQTLVKPKQKISAKITELTGIDDEMVATAPAFKDVLPDFFKFAWGSVLVAHNADFDVKFMKHHARPFDYYFKNKVVDTVQLAREALPNLSNHKLNTVAEHFNVKFLHHRALSDAYATAQIFIELVKMKKTLPDL